MGLMRKRSEALFFMLIHVVLIFLALCFGAESLMFC